MLKHNARRLAVAGLTVLIVFSQVQCTDWPRSLKGRSEVGVKKLTAPALKKAPSKKKKKTPLGFGAIDKVQGAEFMGDYAGARVLADGKKVRAAAQVLALGDGNHSVNILPEFGNIRVKELK